MLSSVRPASVMNMQTLLLLQFCGLFVLNAWLVSGNNVINTDVYVESVSSQSLSISTDKIKLRLCATHNITIDAGQDKIEIPTFSYSGNYTNYLLKTYKEHKIDNEGPHCPNGENPSFLVTATTKADFDKVMGQNFNNIANLYPLLRRGNFLYHSGYLSVGYNNISAIYYPSNEFCVHAIRGRGDNTTVDFKICPLSENRPTIRKCCPLGMVKEKNFCTENRNAFKWDPEYMDEQSRKILTLHQVNPVFKWIKLSCNASTSNPKAEPWEVDNCDIDIHPVTDNKIAFIGVHRVWEFSHFSLGWCMELEQPEGENDRLVFWHCTAKKANTKRYSKIQAKISSMYMINMYIGAFFHFLTTLVYLLTWRMQNIHGRTLCFCTTSLFFMQLFMGTVHLLGKVQFHRQSPICIANGIGAQYFMIAAFTWLVAVNFDLWNTFGSIRTEGGRGFKRFLIYNSLAWGFPTIVSIISVALDFSFPCRTSGVPVPNFGEHLCFVAPWTQGLYVYYILGFLIAVTFVFSALTWIGLYNFKKDSVNLRSTKVVDEQQKVMLYLKLSVLMGLTWVFEVISWAVVTEGSELHVAWIILDFYNSLSAILIFIFFVCKRSTMNLLEQIFPKLKGLSRAASRFSSNFSFSGNTSVTTTESK